MPPGGRPKKKLPAGSYGCVIRPRAGPCSGRTGGVVAKVGDAGARTNPYMHEERFAEWAREADPNAYFLLPVEASCVARLSPALKEACPALDRSWNAREAQVVEMRDGGRRTLRHVLGQKRLGREERLRAIHGTLAAMRWLHESGWGHMDMKTDNVVVDDETGRPRLIDFSFAAPLTQALRDRKGVEQQAGRSWAPPEMHVLLEIVHAPRRHGRKDPPPPTSTSATIPREVSRNARVLGVDPRRQLEDLEAWARLAGAGERLASLADRADVYTIGTDLLDMTSRRALESEPVLRELLRGMTHMDPARRWSSAEAHRFLTRALGVSVDGSKAPSPSSQRRS